MSWKVEWHSTNRIVRDDNGNIIGSLAEDKHIYKGGIDVGYIDAQGHIVDSKGLRQDWLKEHGQLV